MKKILSVLLSALLLLTMMPVGIIVAAAEGAPTITLVAPEQSVEKGSTFTVDVVMTNNPGLEGWQFLVDYNVTLMEIVSVEATDLFAGVSFGPTDASPFSALWVDALHGNNVNNGTIYTITFKVKMDAPLGDAYFYVGCADPDSIFDENFDTVALDYVGTCIEIIDHTHTYDNACDAGCNICGETREVEPHVYENTCDTTCNVCGAVRTIEHTYTDVCDSFCDICGATRVAPHAYDHAVDTTCNLCGYVRDLGEVPTIYVAVPEDAVTIDGTFTVDVKVKNNPGIVAWHAWLSYDSSALELISTVGGDSFGTASFGPLTSPLSMLWVDAIHSNVTADGVLCTLTFRVLKDMDGAYDLTLSVSDWDDFFNSDFTTVYFDLQGATLLTVEHTHAYDGAVTTAPTCTEDGVKTYICSVCGGTYTESIPSLGHAYESVVTAPTCEAMGHTTHTCTRCGDSYVDAEVAALGHNYSGEVTTEPTCIADGVKTYTCANCGDSYTGTIPASGEHTYEHPCSENCTVCGNTNDAAAEHTYSHVYDADCDVCGTIREVTILAGDLNGDGKVNIKDLGLLQQHLNGWEVELLTDVADVNADGKVNIKDLGLLQQYLNGWDVTLQPGVPVLKVVTDQARILADIVKLGKNEYTPYIAQLTGKVLTVQDYNAEHGSVTLTFRVGEQNIMCYQMKGNGVDKVKPGDTITVKGVIKNYYYEGATKGTIEFAWHEASGTEVILEKLVAAPIIDLSTTEKILNAAFSLQPGESLSQEVTLTGKVLNIEDPFSADFLNITVNIKVNDKTLKCYRMKGNGIDKIKAGDTITVQGYIMNYNGTIEFATGCEMTKRVAGTTPGIETDTAKILSDAAALQPGQSLSYQAQLTGTITEITTEYNSAYKNITVIIEVENQELTCYRLRGDGAENLKVGDVITVTGRIKNYLHSNGDCEIEFDQGCTFVFA